MLSRLNGRRDSTIETLEGHCPAHADEVAGNVFITLWDLSSAEDGGVVPNSSGCTQFSDLTIVHESRNDLWQGIAGPVCIGSVDSWSLSEESDEAAEVWQHHR